MKYVLKENMTESEDAVSFQIDVEYGMAVIRCKDPSGSTWRVLELLANGKYNTVPHIGVDLGFKRTSDERIEVFV